MSLDDPSGSDEQPGLLDFADTASREQSLKDVLAHMLHLHHQGITRFLSCEINACFLLDDLEAVPKIIKGWLINWRNLRKTAFWNLPEERKECSRHFAEGIMYALCEYVKREGVGALLAELQNLWEESGI